MKTIGMTGKHHTFETKQKMSLAAKGRKFSEKHKENLSISKKGKPSWNKGLKKINHLSIGKMGFQKGHKGFGTKESYARAGRKKTGENGGTWTGGQKHYTRKHAKIRDNYTCQICGLRDLEIMEVDHIKPKCDYPELRNCLENLVTLCPNCHARKTNRELRERFTRKNEDKI